jgi:hypothetical protein
MDAGIQIQGGKVGKKAISALTKGICEIFQIGHEMHMEQETIRTAIKVMGELGTVRGATVSNCNLDFKDKTITVEDD